ncbi:integration host factor, actinobacterial type [Streptomyces rhizosphaericus]|nr:integration host factor, actinobacterial type [Streptomyces rhizosphaericus]
MGVPTLSIEARTEALQKAAAVRKERAKMLSELKNGTASIKEVLERSDPIAAKTSVRRLLESLPRVGKVRASQLMQDFGIPEGRRIQGLGPRQRARLMERFAAQD